MLGWNTLPLEMQESEAPVIFMREFATPEYEKMTPSNSKYCSL